MADLWVYWLRVWETYTLNVTSSINILANIVCVYIIMCMPKMFISVEYLQYIPIQIYLKYSIFWVKWNTEWAKWRVWLFFSCWELIDLEKWTLPSARCQSLQQTDSWRGGSTQAVKLTSLEKESHSRGGSTFSDFDLRLQQSFFLNQLVRKNCSPQD